MTDSPSTEEQNPVADSSGTSWKKDTAQEMPQYGTDSKMPHGA